MCVPRKKLTLDSCHARTTQFEARVLGKGAEGVASRPCWIPIKQMPLATRSTPRASLSLLLLVEGCVLALRRTCRRACERNLTLLHYTHTNSPATCVSHEYPIRRINWQRDGMVRIPVPLFNSAKSGLEDPNSDMSLV